MKKGKIVSNGVLLKKHEQATVNFFIEKGYTVELLPKSNKQGQHTADLIMNGLEEWEMKAPKGKGKYVFQNTIQKAAKQSCNVIIDIRRLDMPREKVLAEFQKEFTRSKRLRRMMIITKKRELLVFKK